MRLDLEFLVSATVIRHGVQICLYLVMGFIINHIRFDMIRLTPLDHESITSLRLSVGMNRALFSLLVIALPITKDHLMLSSQHNTLILYVCIIHNRACLITVYFRGGQMQRRELS